MSYVLIYGCNVGSQLNTNSSTFYIVETNTSPGRYFAKIAKPGGRNSFYFAIITVVLR